MARALLTKAEKLARANDDLDEQRARLAILHREKEELDARIATRLTTILFIRRHITSVERDIC